MKSATASPARRSGHDHGAGVELFPPPPPIGESPVVCPATSSAAMDLDAASTPHRPARYIRLRLPAILAVSAVAATDESRATESTVSHDCAHRPPPKRPLDFFHRVLPPPALDPMANVLGATTMRSRATGPSAWSSTLDDSRRTSSADLDHASSSAPTSEEPPGFEEPSTSPSAYISRKASRAAFSFPAACLSPPSRNSRKSTSRSGLGRAFVEDSAHTATSSGRSSRFKSFSAASTTAAAPSGSAWGIARAIAVIPEVCGACVTVAVAPLPAAPRDATREDTEAATSEEVFLPSLPSSFSSSPQPSASVACAPHPGHGDTRSKERFSPSHAGEDDVVASNPSSPAADAGSSPSSAGPRGHSYASSRSASSPLNPGDGPGASAARAALPARKYGRRT